VKEDVAMPVHSIFLLQLRFASLLMQDKPTALRNTTQLMQTPINEIPSENIADFLPPNVQDSEFQSNFVLLILLASFMTLNHTLRFKSVFRI